MTRYTDDDGRVWSPTLGRYLPSLDFAKPLGHAGEHLPVRLPLTEPVEVEEL